MRSLHSMGCVDLPPPPAPVAACLVRKTRAKLLRRQCTHALLCLANIHRERTVSSRVDHIVRKTLLGHRDSVVQIGRDAESTEWTTSGGRGTVAPAEPSGVLSTPPKVVTIPRRCSNVFRRTKRGVSSISLSCHLTPCVYQK